LFEVVTWQVWNGLPAYLTVMYIAARSDGRELSWFSR